MARKPRLHIAGAFYHVMLRGNGGNIIFFDDNDRQRFFILLSECINRFNCYIHAYCLMTNHVHLAVQVGEIPLSKIIQNISLRYTIYINKKLNKIGHLFQGRYKAILVDADNYLLQLVKYIHLNPMRAKIVAKSEDYLWSSHRVYLNLMRIDWLTTNYVLGYFSEANTRSRTAYLEFILKVDDVKTNFEIANQKSFPVICDNIFMKKLESLQKSDKNEPQITLEQIIRDVCSFYRIEESQLHKKSRKQLPTKVRAIIVWLAIKFKICTVTNIALYFNRDPSSIYRILNQLGANTVDSELKNIDELIMNATTQA